MSKNDEERFRQAKEYLVAHDAAYPCGKCERDHCAGTKCQEWRTWFGTRWGKVAKQNDAK